MEFDVDELARRGGVSVDTLRYYQHLKLLHLPNRRGRRAVYGDSHLDRLKEIRQLADRGFSLRSIGSLLNTGNLEEDQNLLSEIESQMGGQRYSPAELAEELDIPKSVLYALDQAGLIDDDYEAERKRGFTLADLKVARKCVRLLSYGFPIRKLISLAIKHDRAVRKTVDEAIDPLRRQHS